MLPGLPKWPRAAWFRSFHRPLSQSRLNSPDHRACPEETTMPYQLPPLPYPANALEPHIDARTMEIHHGKHHQAYITNLNAALEKAPDLQSKSIEQVCAGISAVPEAVRTAVRNNGGGHWNHTLFWELMGPNA